MVGKYSDSPHNFKPSYRKIKMHRLRHRAAQVTLPSEMIRSKAARKIRITMCRMVSCQITHHPKKPSALSRKMVANSCGATLKHFRDSWGTSAPRSELICGFAHDGSELYRSGDWEQSCYKAETRSKQHSEWGRPMRRSKAMVVSIEDR